VRFCIFPLSMTFFSSRVLNAREDLTSVKR
jgi:hypothetical protein